jgi:hypothetical protein
MNDMEVVVSLLSDTQEEVTVPNRPFRCLLLSPVEDIRSPNGPPWRHREEVLAILPATVVKDQKNGHS